MRLLRLAGDTGDIPGGFACTRRPVSADNYHRANRTEFPGVPPNAMSTETPATPSPRHLACKILARGIVPAWIAAGAAFKLWERNPQLLPKPVTDVTDFIFVRTLGIPRETYLDPAMRGMVAVEFACALIMLFAPLAVARRLGIAMLGLFVAILGVLLASGAASCGCFGNAGPSPLWMLVIDGSMLLGLLFAVPTKGATSPSYGPVLPRAILAAGLGAAIAFLVPARAGVSLDGDASAAPPPQPAATTQPATAQPTATQQAATPTGTQQAVAPAPPAPPAATGTRPWPPAPASAKPWYSPEFEKWQGQRLDAQELALIMQRPLPVNPNEGRMHVVFIREDCDHCHELLNRYFSGKLATPTVCVVVPDATGELLENPCTECTKATLPGGGKITYVFTTPVLLTLQDGVVVGVCQGGDIDRPEAVRAALDAGKK